MHTDKMESRAEYLPCRLGKSDTRALELCVLTARNAALVIEAVKGCRKVENIPCNYRGLVVGNCRIDTLTEAAKRFDQRRFLVTGNANGLLLDLTRTA